MSKKIIILLNSILIFLPTIVLASGDEAYEKTAVIANEVLKIVAWAGYVIALGILMAIGIKYMLGAADEKAKMKDAFPKYLIGIVLVIFASTVAAIVAEIAAGEGGNDADGIVDTGLEIGNLEVGGPMLGTPSDEPSDTLGGPSTPPEEEPEEEPPVEEEPVEEIKETEAREEINEATFAYWEVYELDEAGNRIGFLKVVNDKRYPEDVIRSKHEVVPVYSVKDDYRALPTFVAANPTDGSTGDGTSTDAAPPVGDIQIIPAGVYVGGFVARTGEPPVGDPYWTTTAAGGKNLCIEISNGDVMPNCVGYAWGRFMEIMGGETPKLSTNHAKTFYGRTSDGYERGQEPRLGAVACWGGGEYGHVAIVEDIEYKADGTVDYVLISESHYGGGRFNTRKIYPSNNYGGIQGFIYNPAVEYAENVPLTPDEAENL